MNHENKPFLPHPVHKPLAYAVISMLAGMVSFFIIWLGIYLGKGYELIMALGILVFSVSFLTALFFFFKYGWSLIVKRGWQKENNDYLKSLEPKQPWE